MTDDSTGVFESRKGGGGKGDKKGGGMGALLGMAMMMKGESNYSNIPVSHSELFFTCVGTMMAMGLAAIAGLAGKALLAATLALALAGIAGLASLKSGGGDKKTTYEIISKPVYSHSHSHTTGHGGGHGGSEEGGHIGGYGGYGRSFIDSFPLPESVKA